MTILANNTALMKEHFDTCEMKICSADHANLYSRRFPDARPVEVFIETVDEKHQYDEFLVINSTDRFYEDCETGWYRRGEDGEVYKVTGIWMCTNDFYFSYSEVLADQTLLIKTPHDPKDITLDMLDSRNKFFWGSDEIDRDDFIYLIKEITH